MFLVRRPRYSLRLNPSPQRARESLAELSISLCRYKGTISMTSRSSGIAPASIGSQAAESEAFAASPLQYPHEASCLTFNSPAVSADTELISCAQALQVGKRGE